MIVGPLCAILAIGLTQVVALVMGPNWTVAGQAALPLVALLAWSGCTFPSGVALVALGQARLALYANLGSLVCSTPGVLAWRPTDPWQAVMIWTVSQILVSPYLMWASARALRVGIFRPLTGGFTGRTAAGEAGSRLATRSRT